MQKLTQLKKFYKIEKINKMSKSTTIRRILAYLSKHNYQATSLIAALSVGFVIAVFCVGYAFIIQAKHGCLTIFFQKAYETKINGNSDNN